MQPVMNAREYEKWSWNLQSVVINFGWTLSVPIHWLPVCQTNKKNYLILNKITLNIFLFVIFLAGAAPKYLSDVCQYHQFNIRSSTPSFCTPKRPFWCLESGQRIMVPEDLLFLDLGCGTPCLCLFVNYMTNRNTFKKALKTFRRRSSSERFCRFNQKWRYTKFLLRTWTYHPFKPGGMVPLNSENFADY